IVSMSSLQFHFLQTLEHRTDVSVTSTSPRWEAPEGAGSALGTACPGSPRCPLRIALRVTAQVAPLGPWSLPGAAPLPLLMSQPVPVPLGLETFGCVAQNPPH
uniref:Uncharacterized protein n=1 Tax=Strigops habroptila TaxID=2489341 RepID=A0A672U6S2_STRHB